MGENVNKKIVNRMRFSAYPANDLSPCLTETESRFIFNE
jgi:hypothetical protein